MQEKTKVQFTKMHGIGNDFVIIDGVSTSPLPYQDLHTLSKLVNDRKFGIGGDGLILIERGKEAPFRMRMFNPDGSEAEMCGNGIRCVAKYVKEHELTSLDNIPIETGAGLLELGIIQKNGSVDAVKVNMGQARLKRKDIPMLGNPDDEAINVEIHVNNKAFNITAVSMGNPHIVIFANDVSKIDLEEIGPILENHSDFPARTNVHFVQVVSKTELIQRTWERGAGVTLACGTGACACLVASYLNGLTERKALIHLPGGDLEVEYTEDGTVFMTGPAETVFVGEITL